MTLDIPKDMVLSERVSGPFRTKTVGIRDILIVSGATDEQLKEHDRVTDLCGDILGREPWRDKRWYREVILKDGTVSELKVVEGHIDWSGTEMQEIVDRQLAETQSRPRTICRKVGRYWVSQVQVWGGSDWIDAEHDYRCDCPSCVGFPSDGVA
jgi:hypothetical protein